MAVSTQLIELVSKTTGLALATVVDIDRRLVKSNLRTKGGRGLNAARMTPLDAARLLTAILGSAQAYVSVDAVERYTQTRVDKARSSDKLYGAANLEDLAALPARHSFIEALAALIASAGSGSLATLIPTSRNAPLPNIEVFAFTRATRGRIRIGLPSGLTASIEYQAVPATEQTGRQGRKRANEVGDLEQSRRITERTILPIAKLLSKGGADD